MRNSVVFVTGAGTGIGAACARRFAAAGARVVLAGRRKERLDALASELGAGVACVLELDVRRRDDVERAVGDLPPELARVDVLVNNAGLARGTEPAHEASLDDWDEMIDTNCRGLVTMTRALLPGMVARKSGHVVNIGSVAGTYPYPGGNVYGATKAFVHQFNQNLKADLLGTGVRVTSIEPGMVAGTEFSEVRFHGDQERARGVYAGLTPLGADDIADAIVWAVSRPAHVNINVIEMMCAAQAFSPYAFKRGG